MTTTPRDTAEALAAVAAAASSQNLSPSQAAQAAREAAHSWIHHDEDDVPTRFIGMEIVKEHLRAESPILTKLKGGENDAFLEYILLLQHYKCQEGETTHAAEAAEKVILAVKLFEDAYNGLLDLIPFNSSDEGIIPDLLPPCISSKGDATQAFFEACKETLEASTESTEKAEAETLATEPEIHEEISQSNSSKSVFSMFRRKNNPLIRRKKKEEESRTTTSAPLPPTRPLKPGEYWVVIEKDMLGLTVENVLERTIVRTVLPGGPAKKAGAKIGSLIVQVGNVDTRNLTHFETIDELRQSQRPLQLIMRQVSENALRSAREEMGRLIKGAGFGNITEESPEVGGRPLIGNDMRLDNFTKLIRRRMDAPSKFKKDDPLTKACEKLVWILTLYVVGMEKEAHLLRNQNAENKREGAHAEDYDHASKSVSKVLFDFASRRIQTKDKKKQKEPKKISLPPPPASGKGKGRGAAKAQVSNSSMIHDKPLLQIGDVLQRIRGFLADTLSPPAALMRGEIISFLCDVLDADTEMELAAEENEASATAGAKSASTDDLGSAGSLLKLIILNCPVMKSPGCNALSKDPSSDEDLQEELNQRFGSREAYSSKDLHSLHAGNRFLAIVHRLAASRSTSARTTACSLGPVIWGNLDFPHQLQLRGVITRALHDVEVIVRKATATVLHELAELVFDSRCVPWLVLMCERAMTDPEPQLRSAAMTLTWHLAEHLPNAFIGDASQGSRYLQRLPSRDDPIFADVYLLQCKLLPVSTRLAEDRSPSVRLAVAAQCDRLCDSLGDHWSSVVIDVLLALLSDSDERVRCEAVLCVPRLAQIVLLSVAPGQIAVSEISVLEALVPAAIRLHKDSSSSVRVSLAESAGNLLTLMVDLQQRTFHGIPSSPPESPEKSESGRQYKRIVDEKLIPLVQNLLNDKDPEVTSAALRALTNTSRSQNSHKGRLASVASDDEMSLSSFQSQTSGRQPVFMPVLSEGQVLRLLPTLTELAESKQWRVRQSAVEIVPALLGCTSKHETRLKMSNLCVRLMSDQVDTVRKTAAECLCMGGSSLGSHGEDASSQWISSVVIPSIRSCASSKLSKQRLLSLKMVEVVLTNGVCPSKWKGEDSNRVGATPLQELAMIALSLSDDRIANVRLNVGRTLGGVLYCFEEDDLALIREGLTKLIESEESRGNDKDVLFFASRCLRKLKGEPETPEKIRVQSIIQEEVKHELVAL